ncbi:hypothetical protein HanPI659440_Chr17g0664481 [Helianthus annuus]|nr:hypothetical protein HanPI659440_Chr17g0664481 [Helianthus annuus]
MNCNLEWIVLLVCVTFKGGRKRKARWAGAPPGKENFSAKFRRKSRPHPLEFFVRTSWNFRPHLLQFFVCNP